MMDLMTETDRQDLIDRVLNAILIDVLANDVSSLEVLLHSVDTEHLLAFLPEQDNTPF